MSWLGRIFSSSKSKLQGNADIPSFIGVSPYSIRLVLTVLPNSIPLRSQINWDSLALTAFSSLNPEMYTTMSDNGLLAIFPTAHAQHACISAEGKLAGNYQDFCRAVQSEMGLENYSAYIQITRFDDPPSSVLVITFFEEESPLLYLAYNVPMPVKPSSSATLPLIVVTGPDALQHLHEVRQKAGWASYGLACETVEKISDYRLFNAKELIANPCVLICNSMAPDLSDSSIPVGFENAWKKRFEDAIADLCGFNPEVSRLMKGTNTSTFLEAETGKVSTMIVWQQLPVTELVHLARVIGLVCNRATIYRLNVRSTTNLQNALKR